MHHILEPRGVIVEAAAYHGMPTEDEIKVYFRKAASLVRPPHHSYQSHKHLSSTNTHKYHPVELTQQEIDEQHIYMVEMDRLMPQLFEVEMWAEGYYFIVRSDETIQEAHRRTMEIIKQHNLDPNQRDVEVIRERMMRAIGIWPETGPWMCFDAGLNLRIYILGQDRHLDLPGRRYCIPESVLDTEDGIDIEIRPLESEAQRNPAMTVTTRDGLENRTLQYRTHPTQEWQDWNLAAVPIYSEVASIFHVRLAPMEETMNDNMEDTNDE